MNHLDDSIAPALSEVRQAPQVQGTVELIVCRPRDGERVVLDEVELDLELGLVGDNWSARPSSRTPDGSPHPRMQITLMNSRAARLIAGDRERWPLCGDQIYVDFDLSSDHCIPGTLLEVGSALLTISEVPHTGCLKFARRFGDEACRLVNSPEGRALNLRGINAWVTRAGQVRIGDKIRREPTGL